MNNQRIALVSLIIICALASFLMLGSSFIHGDANNFANYKLLHASKEFLGFQDLNTYFVSKIYHDKPFSFFINILFLFSLVLILIPVVRGRFRYEVFIFVLMNPLWLSRFAEPSREFLLYLFCYSLGISLAVDNRKLKWISTLIVFVVRPVYGYVIMTWVWVFERRYKLILFSVLALIVLVSVFEPLTSFYYLYASKSGDYKGSYNISFMMRLIMNFLGGINSFYQNDKTYEFFLFFGGYIWRVLAIFYIIKRDYALFLKFCLSTAILLTIVYPFPHPRYLEPAIYLTLGMLSVNKRVGSQVHSNVKYSQN